ncbi:AtpZ/AtpI family protein [bacterium]|jgi:F0F1-type ATP synthase assembly protein I|nr:AtpZ/AtpI family protein [bacterium]
MKNQNQQMGEMGKYFSLLIQCGLIMVLSIIIGLGLGVWIQKTWSLPTGIIIPFILLGVGAGFYNLFKQFSKLE